MTSPTHATTLSSNEKRAGARLPGLAGVMLLVAVAAWPAGADAQPGPAVVAAHQAPLIIDPLIDSWEQQHLMTEPLEPVYFIKPEILELMVRYLDRPEDEGRRLAVGVLGDAARHGCAEVRRAAPRLMLIAGDPAVSEPVRNAAIRALAAMDHREATPMILSITREGSAELVVFADETLAAWKNQEAIEIWKKRIGDASVDHMRRWSAILAVGQVLDVGSVDLLRGIVSDESATASHRIAAARSLAMIASRGLEPLAESLSRRAAETAQAAPRSDKPANVNIAQSLALRDTLNATLAAIVVSRHNTPEARKLQVSLSQHREPSVVVEALAPLVAGDPALVKPIVDSLSKNDDAVVRGLAARALIAHKTREGVAVLGPMLGDPDPKLRRFVRDALIRLHGDASLAASVRQQASDQLASARWQNREQAALLAGKINHEAAAKRLHELFCNDPRYEVRQASIAAIRWMNLADMSEPIFVQAKKLRDELLRIIREPAPPQLFRADEPRRPSQNVQLEADLSQALQALGTLRYAKADEFLKLFVPRDPKTPIPQARSSAIWAYGFLHEKDTANTLIPQLIARIKEFVATDPSASEDSLVRRAALLTLGRLHAEKELRGLVRWLNSEAGPGDSIEPALALIYGAKPPEPMEEPPQIPIIANFAQPSSKPLAPPPVSAPTR